VSGLERPENIMSNYIRAMEEDFGENTEVKSFDIDLSLNRSLEELESSYWEFIDATEGEDSSGWSSSVQEDISALEGYLMKMGIL
jgi:hypothetical protein